MFNKKNLFVKIILLICLFLPSLCLPAEFNKDNVISDDDLMNYSTMSLPDIKTFLADKNGFLANYSTADIDNQQRSASEIIYNACQRYALNPKFILATLQKESSLVTRTSASEKLINYAMGFGCPDGQGCSQSYSGFANQIDAAANQIRNGYLVDLEEKNSTIAGWGVGVTKSALDGEVTPQNKATAVAYTYTPWIGYYGGDPNAGGNSLLWDIWQRWFGSSSSNLVYSDGSLLQSKVTGTIYLIKNHLKHPFASLGALVSSYDINKKIMVSESVLAQYDEGDPILFPNYTLLQAPNGAIYLYVNGKKRGIPSREIFASLGYNPEEVLPATYDELDSIPNGPLITESDIYPGGILVQNKQNGSVYFIDEKKIIHEIWSKDIMHSRFKNFAIFEKQPSEIEKYKKGKPIKFANGEIIKSQNDDIVYLIDHGKKRPFKSMRVFKKMGYKKKNIIVTSDLILNLHKNGKIIQLKKNNK